jgi:hypothetical protein
MAEPDEPGLEFSRFAINDRPFCVWDDAPRVKNLRFLQQLQPEFFTYVAVQHAARLDTESDRHFAAAALRVTYGYALETLFALLCAAVQAPDCPLAYVTLYRDLDLVSVVRKISAHQPVLSKVDVSNGWTTLSTHINAFPSGSRNVAQSFARVWSRFAGEYTDGRSPCRVQPIEARVSSRARGVFDRRREGTSIRRAATVQ